MSDNHSVYLPGSAGPFRCDNCEYYSAANSCNQTNIVTFAKKRMYGLTMNSDGTAKVDPAGCSDYYESKEGNDQPDDESSEVSDSPMNSSNDLPMRRPTSKVFGG